MIDFLPKAFCILHGAMVNTIGNDHFHLDAARAFAICEGPFASCPFTDMTEDEWAFLFASAEKEEPEQTE